MCCNPRSSDVPRGTCIVAESKAAEEQASRSTLSQVHAALQSTLILFILACSVLHSCGFLKCLSKHHW